MGTSGVSLAMCVSQHVIIFLMEDIDGKANTHSFVDEDVDNDVCL